MVSPPPASDNRMLLRMPSLMARIPPGPADMLLVKGEKYFCGRGPGAAGMAAADAWTAGSLYVVAAAVSTSDAKGCLLKSRVCSSEAGGNCREKCQFAQHACSCWLITGVGSVCSTADPSTQHATGHDACYCIELLLVLMVILPTCNRYFSSLRRRYH